MVEMVTIMMVSIVLALMLLVLMQTDLMLKAITNMVTGEMAIT
jgi:hypothetical protein